jgi:hypothetical protein
MRTYPATTICEICDHEIVGPVYWRHGLGTDADLMICKICHELFVEKKKTEERRMDNVSWLLLVGLFVMALATTMIVVSWPLIYVLAYVVAVVAVLIGALKLWGRLRG